VSTAATRHRPRRPASSRGGAGSRARVAFDLGRAGEEAPGWLGDHPSYETAYNRGVDERDRAEAGAPAREPEPDTPVETPPSRKASTSSGDSSARTAPAGAGRDDGSARDGPGQPPAPQAGFRRKLAGAARTDAAAGAGRVAMSIDDGAGLVFGAIAYALFVNAVKSPTSAPDGIKAWFRAKFFNVTTAQDAGDRKAQLGLQTLLVGPLVTSPERNRAPIVAKPPKTGPGSDWMGGFLLGGTPAPKPAAPKGAGG
jgi:hypothetical protein